MTVRKQENGTWLADIRPNGSTGKRYRKQFNTKADALRWEAWIKSKKTKTKDWEPEAIDNRRLSDLIKRWFDTHGQNLKKGENYFALLSAGCKAMKNPLARELTAGHFSTYRNERLASGAAASSLNLERTLLGAVFNTLESLGEWTHGNPIRKAKRLKESAPKTRFLTLEEIDELLTALKTKRRSHAYYIALICLATGARWSEAESLTLDQVTETHITFWNTKNGQNRSVPITRELYDTIPKREGKLFKDGLEAFTIVSKELSFNFPPGQLTHILRHSFASHFAMAGGNLIALQKILGHSSLNITMRYAHLSPDYIDSARTLNPLAKLDTFRTKTTP